MCFLYQTNVAKLMTALYYFTMVCRRDPAVSVSYGCHEKKKKSLQTRRLKTTTMYVLLELGSTDVQKPRRWHGGRLPPALRESPFPVSRLVSRGCQQALVFPGLWLHDSLSSSLPGLCLSVFVRVSYKDSSLHLGPNLSPG